MCCACDVRLCVTMLMPCCGCCVNAGSLRPKCVKLVRGGTGWSGMERGGN